MPDTPLRPEPIPKGSTWQRHDDQGDGDANVDPDTGRPLISPDGTPFVPEVDDD